MLKSTTRHVHIFAGTLVNGEMLPDERNLTLDIDPDNEFLWDKAALDKIYREFDRLVGTYRGEDLTEYYLRRIGSDLEHFIRSMLQKGEIAYNLDSRVLNYSMGRPRVE